VVVGYSWADADEKASKFVIPVTDDGLPGAGPIRRTKWFRGLWEHRRAAFAKQMVDKQGAVVFLGDSITQGWRDDFRGHFVGVNKANRGISGHTTRGMLIRLQRDVLPLNPSAFIMLMGPTTWKSRLPRKSSPAMSN